MNTFQIRGYDTSKNYKINSKTNLFFVLLKISIFIPIIMFF